jgi:lysophospholipase L1-like esterase
MEYFITLGRCVGRTVRPAFVAFMVLTIVGFVAYPVAFAGDNHGGGYKFGFGGYGGNGDYHGDRDGDQHWVGTWATSPQATNSITFNNQTLRMIVHTSIGGKKVRVRFSNAYGTVPLVIGAAHIALRAPCTVIYPGYLYQPPCPTCTPPTGAIQPPPPGGTCATADGSAIVPGSDRVLTFGGSPSIKVFPGAVMVSDPVNLNVPALTDLAVSFYLPNSFDTTAGNLITRHGTAKQTSYISAPDAGDLTELTTWAAQAPTLVTSWYFLNTVEVSAPEQTGVIVALGDSITDANVSTQDTNYRWPYELARRLNGKYSKHPMGVLDHGTGGDKVTWDAVTGVLGGNDSGQHRFDRDVIAAPGVTHVIVLLGVNDLRNSPNDNADLVVTADEVISGYKQMILRAHSSGIKIYGGTLTPWWMGIFTGDNWTMEKWQKHEDINNWIRTSHAFDGVVDFDKCLADPNDPKNMLPIYDSGDHLHPGDAGYVHMGDCIDLDLFREDNDHH